jgi:rhodanese-related sulfurtransferase
VAKKFLEAGYTKVFVLKGGWDGWVNAGFPTEKK